MEFGDRSGLLIPKLLVLWRSQINLASGVLATFPVIIKRCLENSHQQQLKIENNFTGKIEGLTAYKKQNA
jgi:hypothetical protein